MMATRLGCEDDQTPQPMVKMRADCGRDFVRIVEITDGACITAILQMRFGDCFRSFLRVLCGRSGKRNVLGRLSRRSLHPNGAQPFLATLLRKDNDYGGSARRTLTLWDDT